MRVFFAIDEKSHIGASTIRKLLSLQLSNRRYEILRLGDEHFHCSRGSLDALFTVATFEGRKILSRYADATACVVIAGAKARDIHCKGQTAPLDYGVVVTPRLAIGRLLNPKIRGEVYWASSPALQPELAEAAIELAGFELTS